MALTRASFRTRLLLRLGGRTDVEDMIQTWGDEGLMDLCSRRLNIRSLQGIAADMTTVPNVPILPLPPNVFSVRYLSDYTNKRVYRRFDGGMYEFLLASQNAGADIPAQFIEDGPYIFLTPVPSGYFTLIPFVYNRGTWGTQSTDSPSIEPEWHQGVLLLGAKKAFQDLGDEERTAAVEMEFQTWLAERDTAIRRTTRDNITQRGPRAEVGRRNRFGV